MAMDVIARGLALSVDAKIGNLPKGKTVMEVISAIEERGYDDSELIERIEILESQNTTINKDLEALKGLLTEDKLDELVTETVEAKTEEVIKNTVSPIALSGNINDLTQDEGDYVVLACGSSDKLA